MGRFLGNQGLRAFVFYPFSLLFSLHFSNFPRFFFFHRFLSFLTSDSQKMFFRMATVFDRRSESRASRFSEASHGEVVNDTLNALVEDVNKTTDLIRRRQREMQIERRTFQTEMEVNGRISVEPSEDWLNLRLKSVSNDDMKKELGKLKDHQRHDVVTDTMAALAYDVNATAEVLRRGSLKRKKPGKNVHHEEIEYRLRLTPAPDDDMLYHKEDLPPQGECFTFRHDPKVVYF